MAEVDTNSAIFVGKGEKPALLSLALLQPARPGHRRDRHRQDRDPAGAGRRASRAPACRCLPPTSRAISRASPPSARPRTRWSSAPRTSASTTSPTNFPAVFWDVFGEQGHPVRATISEMGPLLLSRMMDLNDVQEGVLNIAFRVADEQGLLLLDLKDLRAMLGYHRRACRRTHDAIRQCLEGDRSARSSASFWCWRTRAPPNSSASRRWR